MNVRFISVAAAEQDVNDGGNTSSAISIAAAPHVYVYLK